MPKENVNCIAMTELRAEVSWATQRADSEVPVSGYVQLATVHTDSPATIPCEHKVHVVKDPVTSEPTGAECSCGATSTATDVFECPEEHEPGRLRINGWHVTLDRAGCNRLIWSLRKARDAAFEADA